ncbi:helicase-related protein [Ignavibacterium sp.]|uniref:helicase-related protein n=1 Tax=Ignavibacterium sp. TaxID=2651167 RepID=UPI00307F6DCF
MNNFITNQPTKDLRKRINELVKNSEELKFLIGFFYFSGIRELYNELKNNDKVTIKVLVGMNVDYHLGQLVEISYSSNPSDEKKVNDFFQSVKKSINTDFFDNKEFYEQVKFFIELIKSDRLLIRKTSKPNHSKLYLFKLDEKQIGRNKLFITGSSNLTQAGLSKQNEFNVEISDYGYDDAEKYFDELWETAIRINEAEDFKKKLITLLEEETLVKEISPFEAYVLILKNFLETYIHKNLSTYVIEILKMNGYKQYQYQLDAVKQALAIIETYNGVLIADVVGLGKTIIACATAKQLRKRGVVICPPGLIGDDNGGEGWKKYLDQFELRDWKVRSLGDLEKTFEYVKEHNDIEVVIVDEAHRFRNQDTKGYELLKNICRNKIVILLTATPFNNKPEDVLSLLSFFITPKKSSITLDSNLVITFRFIGSLFDKLGFISKYHNSKDQEKRSKAKNYYQSIFDSPEINITKVVRKTHQLAKQIREVIEPITIRRNRLDLQRNPNYRNEVKQLSVVQNPQEWFYELTIGQSKFYDEVISEFFAPPDEGGKFKGAIYRPFEYEQGIVSGDDLSNQNPDKESNRELIQQRNLFDIMRRLLVKRFESSFSAFQQSINNFIRITENVLKFIEKTGKGDFENGEYILDRDLLENILELDEEEMEKSLLEYEQQIAAGVYPKKHKRYKIKNFVMKGRFIEDIQSDLSLFKRIINRIDELKLVDNDPKAECLLNHIKDELSKTPAKGEPKRKIVIFSEYADTVRHLSTKIEQLDSQLAERTLVVYGALGDARITEINKNFDASAKNQTDDYDILLSTDKLSEGFNLNRAGMVINYDIPWNPVRVIQRLGRINRISKKVFEYLFIVNFFPTEKGAEFVRSREIAQNKMFMIHNTLGEDSKIFDPDEEPSPAKLYQKLNQNPEENDEESFYTKVVNLYSQLAERYPDIVKKLNTFPKRIKTAKAYSENEMLVFFRKNRLYVKSAKKVDDKVEISDTSLELVLDKIKCELETKSLPIDDEFWNIYEKVKEEKVRRNIPTSEMSIERKALNNIEALLRNNSGEEILAIKPFLRVLREDIIDYGTLPDYSLRRIAQLKLNDLKNIVEEITAIKNELGEDYLEKEKKKFEGEKEIIIAINNLSREFAN